MSFFDDDTARPKEDFDRIEVDMTIRVFVENVWGIVAESGWRVNDGPIGNHEVTRDEHGYYRVNDPEAGEWLVEKGDKDPMDIVSFCWYPLASDELPEDASTSIEISLSEEGSGIAVHVEESDFFAITEDDTSTRSTCGDELTTWEVALAAMEAHLEARTQAVGAHFQGRKVPKARRGVVLSGILTGMGASSPPDSEGT